MSKPDWADEKADEIAGSFCHGWCGCWKCKDDIADALREARTATLREAAQECDAESSEARAAALREAASIVHDYVLRVFDEEVDVARDVERAILALIPKEPHDQEELCVWCNHGRKAHGEARDGLGPCEQCACLYWEDKQT